MRRPFDSIYTHGFARVACCVPRIHVADPEHNADRILALAQQASRSGAVLALFPELSLSGYTNEDLFQQAALLERTELALEYLREASRDLLPVLVVGAPLRQEGMLFNCAVVIHRGRVLGVVPKSYLPTYREYYEGRRFAPAHLSIDREVTLLGRATPFGADLIFAAADLPAFRLFVEICEDLWVPTPPSSRAALAGATVLANPAASSATLGKAAYRKMLCASQSARCVAAYLYAGSGAGESTTDLAWDGHALIYEDQELLAEGARFQDEASLLYADIDLDRLQLERMRLNTFQAAALEARDQLERMRTIHFDLDLPDGAIPLQREVPRFPYLPDDSHELETRCAEVLEIQVQGLRQRLESTGIRKLVIGISGGLDSTHALLVATHTFDRLGWPRRDILGYTMPGFATSEESRADALRLMKALGITSTEIDIRPSARQMLHDIGHPFTAGEPVHDVTFENVQAGERTSHLFRLANRHQGLVLGTGDLSEVALGWNTYGVGDQMSHYNVNASVPKTLIQALIAWAGLRDEFGGRTAAVLRSIASREISPELVPSQAGQVQRTEAAIGPYELQDFNLFHITRYGFRPSKVAFLAQHAWGSLERGRWPATVPVEKRAEYALPAIRHWLEVFLTRFFQNQFKRSAMPDGPKIVTGGSLSPRGEWRAPSDASARVWLDELRQNVPAEI